MLFTVFTLAVLFQTWRLTRAAFETLRALPRSNDDLVFV